MIAECDGWRRDGVAIGRHLLRSHPGTKSYIGQFILDIARRNVTGLRGSPISKLTPECCAKMSRPMIHGATKDLTTRSLFIYELTSKVIEASNTPTTWNEVVLAKAIRRP